MLPSSNPSKMDTSQNQIDSAGPDSANLGENGLYKHVHVPMLHANNMYSCFS